MELRLIARVESALTDAEAAPKQGHEGAPDAWLVFDPEVVEGLDGMEPGDRVIVLTWLDRARRDVLRVHPRGDVRNPERGVFGTRSPARPNPIGLHEVEVLAIEGGRVHVRPLEAVDGTPVLDVKPVLAGPDRSALPAALAQPAHGLLDPPQARLGLRRGASTPPPRPAGVSPADMARTLQLTTIWLASPWFDG